jgi:hypothetical protein
VSQRVFALRSVERNLAEASVSVALPVNGEPELEIVRTWDSLIAAAL